MRGLKSLRAGFHIEGDVRALYLRFVGGTRPEFLSVFYTRPGAAAVAHTGLDSVLRLHAQRRRDFGEFRRDIEVIECLIEVPEHPKGELRREIERTGLRSLASLLHHALDQVETMVRRRLET